jgi:hypothetical protein
VQGSMASQSQSTCGARRSRVRRRVQLEVREPEMAEAALVQGVCMLTSTQQKGS